MDHVRIAFAQVRAGELDAADATLRPLLAANPKHARGLLTRGLLASARGEPRGAEADFRSAIALRPENGWFHLELGRLLARDKVGAGGAEAAAAAAMPHMRRAAELLPGSSLAHMELARVARKAGKAPAVLDEAAAHLRRAIEIASASASASGGGGGNGGGGGGEGEGAGGESSGGGSGVGAPSVPNLLFRLGMLLFARGDRAGSDAALQRALELDPVHEQASFWLAAHANGAAGGSRLPPPPAMPSSSVAALFDGYASTFDASLGRLGYGTPRLLLGHAGGVLRSARARLLSGGGALGATSSAAGEGGEGRVGGGAEQPSFRCCADLGCGTGLAGVELLVEGGGVPPMLAGGGTLDGVDLSQGMLEEARHRMRAWGDRGGGAEGAGPRRRMYDRLDAAELVAWLRERAAAGVLYDLVVCVDTLVYIGDLSPMLLASHAAMGRPLLPATAGKAAERAELGHGPLLAFSVEHLPDAEALEREAPAAGGEAEGGVGGGGGGCFTGYVLQDTGRYCHSEAYVRRATEAAGFCVASVERVPCLRRNKGLDIPGLLVVAEVTAGR